MNKFIQKLYEKIWALFAVSYWFQLYGNYQYSESFDNWCRKSLEEGHHITKLDKYSVYFNGKRLWYGNKKLCCFHLYENGKPYVQPSRYTKYLMMKRLNDSWDV